MRAAFPENKTNDLKALIQKYQLDILAVTETWLEDGYEWRVGIDGYQLLNENRQSGKRGGGVAIYLREGIEIDPSKTTKHAAKMPYECLWIKITKPIELYLACVYIYPKKSINNMNKFFSAAGKFIKKNCSEIPFVLIGDFNVDVQHDQELTQNIEQVDQLIHSRTFKLNERTLDHIYVSRMQNVVNSGVREVDDDLSDHNLIFCVLNIVPHQFHHQPMPYVNARRPRHDSTSCECKCLFTNKACKLPNAKEKDIFVSEAALRIHLDQEHIFCYQINDWLRCKPGKKPANKHRNECVGCRRHQQ